MRTYAYRYKVRMKFTRIIIDEDAKVYSEAEEKHKENPFMKKPVKVLSLFAVI